MIQSYGVVLTRDPLHKKRKRYVDGILSVDSQTKKAKLFEILDGKEKLISSDLVVNNAQIQLHVGDEIVFDSILVSIESIITSNKPVLNNNNNNVVPPPAAQPKPIVFNNNNNNNSTNAKDPPTVAFNLVAPNHQTKTLLLSVENEYEKNLQEYLACKRKTSEELLSMFSI